MRASAACSAYHWAEKLPFAMHVLSLTTRLYQWISRIAPVMAPCLALPHYDTRDVSAITDLPYMVVSHDLGQCAIALSQLENAR